MLEKERASVHFLMLALLLWGVFRLKNTVRQQAVSAGGVSSIRVLLESQTVRVHELEDEIASSRTTIASLNGQLQAARDEAARWSNTAQQRLAAMDELSQRYPTTTYTWEVILLPFFSFFISSVRITSKMTVTSKQCLCGYKYRVHAY